MTAVGYIVGEARTDEFTFVTNAEIAPPRLEYVVVHGVQEQVGEKLQAVDSLAQVAGLSVSSRLLDTTMSYGEVQAILNRLGGAQQPVIIGTAKVLGYLDNGVVRFPRHAATPGAEVHLAPDDLLRQFFSRNVTSGIEIGTLINRPSVDVLLDPNGLRRHLAVIAQTGAGKSYTVGVVLEKLLELGGTVVVFDPNSDYVLMRRDERQRATSFAERVEVYRLPTEQRSRITDEEIGGARKFQVQFSKLEPDEICAMTGIGETWSSVRKAISTAWDSLRGQDYTPHIFVQELERLSQGSTPTPTHPRQRRRESRRLAPGVGDEETVDAIFRARRAEKTDEESGELDFDTFFEREEEPEVVPEPTTTTGEPRITLDVMGGAERALKYIERLEHIDIWGFEDVPMDDILRPMNLSVIDLAGVDQWIAEFVVDKVLREAWSRATTEGLPRPLFIVLEEAHNFVPGGKDTRSQCAGILKRIASEGRKFGLFLVLITQRPYRIHQDTLSQCNSQIIMRLTNPEDQNAVRRASESISEGLLADLPGLNVGEAVILGPLVRVPVMVRVGKRRSREGGSDIDVVAALERARGEVVTDRMERTAKAERKARGRTEWKEEV
jgi:DNA helicase HerA-like ATPase